MYGSLHESFLNLVPKQVEIEVMHLPYISFYFIQHQFEILPYALTLFPFSYVFQSFDVSNKIMLEYIFYDFVLMYCVVWVNLGLSLFLL